MVGSSSSNDLCINDQSSIVSSTEQEANHLNSLNLAARQGG